MLVFEWVFFVVLLRFQLLCSPTGVPGAACCVRPGCSIRPPSTAHDLPSSVWSLCVPVGGGPPASRPRCELRSARRLEARPGPATAHGHRSQAHPTSESSHAKPLLGLRRSPPALTPLIPEPTRNFACNSPDTISNLELRSLELQRFQTLLELLSIELHATFRGQTPNTTTGTAAWHLTHD